MTAHHYTNYRLPSSQAARLSSLGGIQSDLDGVVAYCNYLEDNEEFSKLNFLVWEAISAAAVIRYARCFSTGVRHPLPHDLFAPADARIREAHEYFIEVRSKHVAHSVNDLEENEVVIQIGSHFQSSAEIEHIHTSHSRSMGLSFSDPSLLRELAHWVLAKVGEFVEGEKQKLLPLVRACPLEQLRRSGSPELGSGGNRERINKRRARP